MTYEFMVLFGGSIVLISLRRKRTKAHKRTPGFLKVFLLLIDLVMLFGGLVLVLLGVNHFLR
jgi:hypothetical protein